jgi:hypothetical protein
MNKLSREEAYKEYMKTWEVLAKAEETLGRITKRHIWSGPIDAGQPVPFPEALLDKGWLEEIKQAMREVDDASQKLRKAASRFYDACRRHRKRQR